MHAVVHDSPAESNCRWPASLPQGTIFACGGWQWPPCACPCVRALYQNPLPCQVVHGLPCRLCPLICHHLQVCLHEVPGCHAESPGLCVAGVSSMNGHWAGCYLASAVMCIARRSLLQRSGPGALLQATLQHRTLAKPTIQMTAKPAAAMHSQRLRHRRSHVAAAFASLWINMRHASKDHQHAIEPQPDTSARAAYLGLQVGWKHLALEKPLAPGPDPDPPCCCGAFAGAGLLPPAPSPWMA